MSKIAVFTGTRAEYGLLYWLINDLNNDPDFDLQLIVSGSHLSPEFGMTYEQIEKDGFTINEKVEILLSSNSAVGVAKSMGLGVLGFSDALNKLQPDILIILGDRFEALSISQVALVLNIPIMHLHGGETTEGAYDNAIRHAITQFSTWHCVAADVYKQKVIQMKGCSKDVFTVGALGLDYLKIDSLYTRDELEEELGFSLNKPYFLVTYHPATVGEENAEESFGEILSALSKFLDYNIIFTYPNADNGGRTIISMLKKFENSQKERVITIPNLGTKRYLSTIKHSTVVIGNSSSGIIEVPSMKVPTVNIGNRQKGRLAAKSVRHCKPVVNDIVKSINESIAIKCSDNELFKNPYDYGLASRNILDILHNITRVNGLEREVS